jgi:hypothetical protein
LSRSVETWTYNLGANRFMKIPKFEGSELVTIEDGGYGSGIELSFE